MLRGGGVVVVRYAGEEWHYASKSSYTVSLSQRGVT